MELVSAKVLLEPFYGVTGTFPYEVSTRAGKEAPRTEGKWEAPRAGCRTFRIRMPHSPPPWGAFPPYYTP